MALMGYVTWLEVGCREKMHYLKRRRAPYVDLVLSQRAFHWQDNTSVSVRYPWLS